MLATVRVTLSLCLRIVTIRSTRLPGWMYPATPITSFTFTEIARMPRGMAEGRPRAAFPRRQLGGDQRLVLEHRRDERAIHDVADGGERARQRTGCRPRHDLHVMLGQPCAQRQRASGNHHGLVGQWDLPNGHPVDRTVHADARDGGGCHGDDEDHEVTLLAIHDGS